MEETMIRIKSDTKEALQNMKIARRESYDEIIKRLIIMIQNPISSHLEMDKRLLTTLKGRVENVKKGKVMSTDELFKKLYLKKEKR